MSDLVVDDYAAVWNFFTKFLSYGIVVGSSTLKVPQILKILKSGSASGISLLSILVELLAYVISLSWGIRQRLPFSDYGENAIIFAQVVFLLSLVGVYQRKKALACGVFFLELVLLYAFLNDLISISSHRKLLGSQMLLNLFSRLSQIVANFKAHSTGQLSFLTFFLAFGGGCARVLTTATNVPWGKGKGILLCQFSLAVLLNFIIILQMFLYRGGKRKVQ